VRATIDIPDDLYRQVKARSALLGRTVRDVTIELYRRWLTEAQAVRDAKPPEAWLRSWLATADEQLKDTPPGPTAREILEDDRNRSEPR
jgi:hypothetical protein